MDVANVKIYNFLRFNFSKIDLLISAGAHDDRLGGVEIYLVHSPSVSRQPVQHLARDSVPDRHKPVRRAC